MKKIIVLALTFLLLFTSSSVFAQEFKNSEKVVLPKNAVINENYFAFGEAVTIEGTVNGDVYAAGGEVLVEGTINGDLLVAGGNVTVRGTVTQDVRVAGGHVTVSGVVRGNVTAAGGQVEIADSAQIAGSLVSGAGSLGVFGPIGKSVTFGAGSATLGATIGGNVLAGVERMNLVSSTNIAGNLTYYSSQQAEVQQGAKIAGKINYQKKQFEQAGRTHAKDVAGFVGGAWIIFKILNALSALIIGLIFIALAPLSMTAAVNMLDKRPWYTMLIGFIALCVTPVLVIILAMTVLGLPIAFFVFLMYLMIVYISKIVVALWVGRKLLGGNDKKPSLGWSLALGLLIWVIVTSIPLIGGLLSFATVIAGVGAYLTEKHAFYLSLKAKKLV